MASSWFRPSSQVMRAYLERKEKLESEAGGSEVKSMAWIAKKRAHMPASKEGMSRLQQKWLKEAVELFNWLNSEDDDSEARKRRWKWFLTTDNMNGRPGGIAHKEYQYVKNTLRAELELRKAGPEREGAESLPTHLISENWTLKHLEDITSYMKKNQFLRDDEAYYLIIYLDRFRLDNALPGVNSQDDPEEMFMQDETKKKEFVDHVKEMEKIESAESGDGKHTASGDGGSRTSTDDERHKSGTATPATTASGPPTPRAASSSSSTSSFLELAEQHPRGDVLADQHPRADFLAAEGSLNNPTNNPASARPLPHDAAKSAPLPTSDGGSQTAAALGTGFLAAGALLIVGAGVALLVRAASGAKTKLQSGNREDQEAGLEKRFGAQEEGNTDLAVPVDESDNEE